MFVRTPEFLPFPLLSKISSIEVFYVLFYTLFYRSVLKCSIELFYGIQYIVFYRVFLRDRWLARARGLLKGALLVWGWDLQL